MIVKYATRVVGDELKKRNKKDFGILKEKNSKKKRKSITINADRIHIGSNKVTNNSLLFY